MCTTGTATYANSMFLLKACRETFISHPSYQLAFSSSTISWEEQRFSTLSHNPCTLIVCSRVRQSAGGYHFWSIPITGNWLTHPNAHTQTLTCCKQTFTHAHTHILTSLIHKHTHTLFDDGYVFRKTRSATLVYEREEGDWPSLHLLSSRPFFDKNSDLPSGKWPP